MKHRPLLLIVLDGWGHREQREHNAVRAGAPFFHELCARYPSTLLSASGEEVGLPLGLMGNSEVGHTNLGAGRIVWQEITRIDRAIREGAFHRNSALRGVMEGVRLRATTLHLLGLVSDGGVHASDQHLSALLDLAKRIGLAREQVVVHAVLDGRDTPPRSGAGFVEALERELARAGVGRIASVVGRYWAMDRDQRWERIERAHALFTRGAGAVHASALAAVRAAYAKEIGDEFVKPCVIGVASEGRMRAGDGLLCFNFRADRMRQILQALWQEPFEGFLRATPARLEIATMTQYRADFPFAVAFPRQEVKGVFSELVSAQGLRQERIAETEKYAHVTFFFSGGREAELPGESRCLVPSPKVATYDLQPEMSAPGVTAAILRSLARAETDVYVINFANADMVGHTGIESAAVAAVRAVDKSLAEIVPLVTVAGGLVAITADHGNAEQMWDEEHAQPHTAHTTNPVPIVLCAEALRGVRLRRMGILADVVPTLCELSGIPKSSGMDGLSLIE